MPLQIETSAIRLLRDRLMETGGAPSAIAGGPVLQLGDAIGGDAEALALLEATIEVMVIVLAADGLATQEERALLRGTLRELTADAVRTPEVDRLTDASLERIKTEGAEKRLASAAEVLKREKIAAEAAFVLAAAMAFADHTIADEENATLSQLAHLLDLDDARANQLLDELDA